MKTHQTTVMEGECLGPIEWAFDFRQFDWTENRGGMNPAITQSKVEMLRQLESGEWEATTDGGWPRVGWGKVLQVGMYDGWPHWKPIPSVFISGPLGGSWHPFYSLTEIRLIKGREGDVKTDEYTETR